MPLARLSGKVRNVQIEDRPTPECSGGYSARQMASMFSDVWDEWEEFAALGFGVTLSECTGKRCGGVAHGVSFPERDVLQFVGWLEHEWPRIKRRRELHRAVVPYLHSDWVGSAAIVRGNLALMRTRPSAAVRGQYLDEWEAAVAAGPDEVEQLATMPGEHGEALRQASPLAGVLPQEELQRTNKEAK